MNQLTGRHRNRLPTTFDLFPENFERKKNCLQFSGTECKGFIIRCRWPIHSRIQVNPDQEEIVRRLFVPTRILPDLYYQIGLTDGNSRLTRLGLGTAEKVAEVVVNFLGLARLFCDGYSLPLE